MPRRNRNAAAIRADTDQLAIDLAQFADDLCCTTRPGTRKTGLSARYLACAVKPVSVLMVTGGTQQPRPHLAPGSR